MNETQTILGRLGNFFRRNGRNGDLPLNELQQDVGTAIEPRSTFLRPWARRDAAIEHLQQGFTGLTDLMSGIRDNLDRQSQRQDELLTYLAHLPEALKSLPETSRAHSETLRAIHTQLEQQNDQQEKLAEILDKIVQNDGQQRETLNDVRDKMEGARQNDEAISSNLNSLGAALASVSQNSTAGAQVLQQMRDRIDARDNQLETVLHRQATRFTTMLAVAIFLSVSALVAVCVIGYMLLQKQG